jgi:hypothetical protein
MGMRRVRVRVRFMVMAGGHDDSRSRGRCSCWGRVSMLLQMDMLTRGCKRSVGLHEIEVGLTESEKDNLGSPFPRDRFDGGWMYSLSRLGVRGRREVDEVVGGSGGSGKEGNGVIGVLVACLL